MLSDAADVSFREPSLWFVTRKHPPAIGGMERLSYEVVTRVAARRSARLVAFRGSRMGLPWFVATAAARVLAGCARGRIAVLHLGDPVLAPLAAIARRFGVPVAMTLHGLDVAHAGRAYRLWTRPAWRCVDVYVCISRAVRDLALASGLPADRIEVISIGVEVPPVASAVPRERGLLLLLGRMVPRKGAAWFVESVFSRVAARHPESRLALIGAGPDRPAVEAAVRRADLSERVLMPGEVGEPEKRHWLARAGLCVVPNLPRAGDFEGFGIAALEAAAAGCPVVAADLEGLRDALADGARGRLVEPGNAIAWVDAIEALLRDDAARIALGEQAAAHARAHAGWEPIIARYCELFDRLAARGVRPGASGGAAL